MSIQYDVVILTEQRYLNPALDTDYIRNVLYEDGLLKDLLESKGLKVTRKNWADKNFDWAGTKYVLFRSTWDYFDRFNEFQSWLASLKGKTTAINSLPLIQWNMDKWYLQDLKEKGIPIVETEFIRKGDKRTLGDLFASSDFKTAIIKPTVAGASRHLYKIDLDNLSQMQPIYKELIDNEDMMLQPFQESVLTKGEVSFVVIGGKFTHAVLKQAKPGDFRVQDDFGGTIKKYNAGQNEIEFAENVVSACPTLPFYARVDVIWDEKNNPVLSEIELIEPELWFRLNRKAAELLADNIYKLF